MKHWEVTSMIKDWPQHTFAASYHQQSSHFFWRIQQVRFLSHPPLNTAPNARQPRLLQPSSHHCLCESPINRHMKRTTSDVTLPLEAATKTLGVDLSLVGRPGLQNKALMSSRAKRDTVNVSTHRPTPRENGRSSSFCNSARNFPATCEKKLI